MDAPSDAQPVRVWDLPTRVFHWLLATTVIGAIVTAKIGGNAVVWHTRLGLFALALLVFRLVWGVVGGRWSRFAAWTVSPVAVLAYLRGERDAAGRHHDVGHNPLGVLSVIALLLVLVAQVATGLIADDEVATTGPLNRFVDAALGLRATVWHEGFGQYLIIGLSLLHLAAVLYYRFGRRVDLIGPMWSGDKRLAPGTPASADGAAQRALAALVAALAIGLAWWIGRLGP